METNQSELAKKLAKSIFSLRKTDWQNRTIAGCKGSEIRVLFCIKNGVNPDNPDMKISDISRILQVTSPTVTQLVKSLEANGMVERKIDSVDRRAVGIKLTEKGEKVTKIAADLYFEKMNGLIEYLGEEKCNQFIEILQKIKEYNEIRNKQASHWNSEGDLW